MQDALEALRASTVSTEEICQQLEQDLVVCLEGMTDASAYALTGAKECVSRSAAHHFQRSHSDGMYSNAVQREMAQRAATNVSIMGARTITSNDGHSTPHP